MDLKEILLCYEKNTARWEKLKKLHANSRLVPFIGAGMSSPIFPQWRESLKNVLNGNSAEMYQLDSFFDAGKYEDACEYVIEKVNNNGFIDRVSIEFSIDKIYKSCEQDRNNVNSNFLRDIFVGPVFTTNFDKMIEYCYKFDFDNTYNLSNMNQSWAVIFDAIKTYKHNIYKIHGDIDDPNSWVFSKHQYDLVYGRKEFVETIELVCRHMNFLFMGCSLTEGDRYIKVLSNVVKECSDLGIRVQHFAFVSIPDGNNKTSEELKREIEEKERFFSHIGIFPIWYPYGMHEAIAIMLKALRENEIASPDFLKTKLSLAITDFINETHLSPESSIDFFEDEKRITTILKLANSIKAKLNESNIFSKQLQGLIDARVDSFNECRETCLCIRDCGKYLGKHELNEYVVTNLYFLGFFTRYANKHGYSISINDLIGDIDKTIDSFIEVMKTPEGTEDFLNELFYGLDRNLLRMDDEKAKLLKIFQEYMTVELKTYPHDLGTSS